MVHRYLRPLIPYASPRNSRRKGAFCIHPGFVSWPFGGCCSNHPENWILDDFLNRWKRVDESPYGQDMLCHKVAAVISRQRAPFRASSSSCCITAAEQLRTHTSVIINTRAAAVKILLPNFRGCVYARRHGNHSNATSRA